MQRETEIRHGRLLLKEFTRVRRDSTCDIWLIYDRLFTFLSYAAKHNLTPEEMNVKNMKTFGSFVKCIYKSVNWRLENEPYHFEPTELFFKPSPKPIVVLDHTLSLTHPHNIEIAQKAKLYLDPDKNCYVDSNGRSAH